jgi:3-dehydroquinate synthase
MLLGKNSSKALWPDCVARIELTRDFRFACAAYRRNTNFIRIPTTVIGLIDASVSIKVAVNYGNYKNRLGAYHAPMHTFLDFSFLKTLPEGQVRNGFAELIKISTCAHKPTFDLLDKYCEKLITSRFGREGDDKEVLQAADEINRAGIYEMLKLETPNLHEIGLDRVIAYGHTWSPLHEVRLSRPKYIDFADCFVAFPQGPTSSRPCHLYRHGLLGHIGEPARSSQR